MKLQCEYIHQRFPILLTHILFPNDRFSFSPVFIVLGEFVLLGTLPKGPDDVLTMGT